MINLQIRQDEKVHTILHKYEDGVSSKFFEDYWVYNLKSTPLTKGGLEIVKQRASHESSLTPHYVFFNSDTSMTKWL